MPCLWERAFAAFEKNVNKYEKHNDKSDKMNQNEFSQLSNEELLEVAKKFKPSPIIDAFFIGFLIGIVVFSVATNTWGLLSLIPLFMVYILLKKPKRYEALKKELKERNLQ